MKPLRKVDDGGGKFVMELVEIERDAKGLKVAPGTVGIRFSFGGDESHILPLHMIDWMIEVIQRWKDGERDYVLDVTETIDSGSIFSRV